MLSQAFFQTLSNIRDTMNSEDSDFIVNLEAHRTSFETDVYPIFNSPGPHAVEDQFQAALGLSSLFPELKPLAETEAVSRFATDIAELVLKHFELAVPTIDQSKLNDIAHCFLY